jgi:hypothetical protein
VRSRKLNNEVAHASVGLLHHRMKKYPYITIIITSATRYKIDSLCTSRPLSDNSSDICLMVLRERNQRSPESIYYCQLAQTLARLGNGSRHETLCILTHTARVLLHTKVSSAVPVRQLL